MTANTPQGAPAPVRASQHAARTRYAAPRTRRANLHALRRRPVPPIQWARIAVLAGLLALMMLALVGLAASPPIPHYG